MLVEDALARIKAEGPNSRWSGNFQQTNAQALYLFEIELMTAQIQEALEE
jgi:hypothetical protein